MLFHLKQTPGSRGVLGYDWLDVLAFQPIATTVCDPNEVGSWAKEQVACLVHCRTEDGFTSVMNADLMFAEDLQAARELNCEYYMAEKEAD